MSNVSKLPPRQPCYAIFNGLRHSRPGYVEVIHEPVQIVEVQNGNKKELAVAMFGRFKKWPLTTLEGEWTTFSIGDEPKEKL